MDEQDKDCIVSRDANPPSGPRNAKERVYEKLRMPLWLLDTIIIALAVAVVVLLIVGATRAK